MHSGPPRSVILPPRFNRNVTDLRVVMSPAATTTMSRRFPDTEQGLYNRCALHVLRALALLLLSGTMGLHAQSLLPGSSGYDEWKAGLLTGNSTLVDLESGSILETRGGSVLCECWIEPDPSYTLINNGSQWSASGTNNNDDGSYGPIALPFQFYLYGQYWNTAYININGNVSFGDFYGTFSSTGFPFADYTMVAPFWADVDLGGTCAGCNQVRFKVTPTALFVNWTEVGYYPEMTNLRNTFQLIITDGTDPVVPNGANVSFCYKDMQWTTGGASGGQGGFGGTPASVGANKGDGVNYLQFGRFDHAGTDYDGPFGAFDGISFLDEQSFSFTTDISTGNIPPNVSGQSVCDSLVLCAGEPGTLDFIFLSPEPDQITTPTAFAPTLQGFQIVSSSPGQNAPISLLIVPTLADTGFHYVTVEGTDNGTPGLTTQVNIVVQVLPSPYASTSEIFLCAAGAPVDLMTAFNGALPTGGDWYDPFYDAYDGVYDPNSDDPGIYLYAVDTGIGCPLIAPVDLVFYDMQNDSLVSMPACNGDTTGMIEVLSTGLGGPWDYTWSNADGEVVQETVAAIGDGYTGPAGTYHVIIAQGAGGNGCVDSLVATIVEPPPVTMIGLSDDTVICRTGSATLITAATGGTGMLTAQWSDGVSGWSNTVSPLMTTAWSVWATDSAGCPSDTLTVDVLVNPTLQLTVPDTVVTCPGVDTPLMPDTAFGGNGDYQFAWASQPFQTGPDHVVNLQDTMTICVTLTDGCETPDVTRCIIVAVKPIPDLVLSADTVLGCDPFAVIFSVQDTTGTALVDWEFGDGTSVPGPSGNVGHTYTDPGIFDVGVTVHWPNGCDADSTIEDMITVVAVPDAQFTWGPSPASTLDPTVQFVEQAGPFAVNWHWDFADVDTAHGPEVEYTFPDIFGGVYPVQLVAENYLGCRDTVVRNVEVMDEFLVFIPNTFTPNGDGINDEFLVLGDDIDPRDLLLMVFDRWGEKVFETTDRSEGWDGTYGGELVQDGIYSWLLEARSFYTGRPHKLMGHVGVTR